MRRICFGEWSREMPAHQQEDLFFFFGLQFWRSSDCGGRLSQVDEADNYAWTPDTVKMSFDPGHSACRRVSEINIFSSGFQNSWGRTPCQGFITPWNSPKVLIAVTGKVANMAPQYAMKTALRTSRVSNLSVALFSENLGGQKRVLVDSVPKDI